MGQPSDHSIIFEVSQRLRAMLWSAIEPHAHFGLRNEMDITFTSPAVRLSGHSSQLSLWMYHITPKVASRNATPKRQANAESDRSTLTLDLHYLITPLATDMDKGLHLVEMVLATFHHQPVFALDNAASGRQTLNITLRPETVIDRAQIWQLLKTEYQLSLAYDVTGVRIG